MSAANPAKPIVNNTPPSVSPLKLFKPNVAATRTRGGYEYIINSMLIIAIIGMCVKIFFGNNTSVDGSYGRANSTIYGYGIAAFAVLTVMFVTFAIHDRIGKIENKGGFKGVIAFMKTFLTSSAPSVLTLVVFGWVISLNVTYYKRINTGSVATEYYQLSAGTSMLFMFQIICLFEYLKQFIRIKTKTTSDDDKDPATALSRIAFANYFIIAINFIVIGMMTIILNFFSTDG